MKKDLSLFLFYFSLSQNYARSLKILLQLGCQSYCYKVMKSIRLKYKYIGSLDYRISGSFHILCHMMAIMYLAK